MIQHFVLGIALQAIAKIYFLPVNDAQAPDPNPSIDTVYLNSYGWSINPLC